jgi:hypothetical protein
MAQRHSWEKHDDRQLTGTVRIRAWNRTAQERAGISPVWRGMEAATT